MIPSESSAALLDFSRRQGVALELAAPAEGIDPMIQFFLGVRPKTQVVEGAGHMLLYQWGIYRFSGSPTFQLNLTRQFIELVEEDGEEEEVMSQLGLTFHYPVSPATEALGDQNRWCESLDDLEAFTAFIKLSAPYVLLSHRKAERVEVGWSQV